jgi:hypothetical protein
MAMRPSIGRVLPARRVADISPLSATIRRARIDAYASSRTGTTHVLVPFRYNRIITLELGSGDR